MNRYWILLGLCGLTFMSSVSFAAGKVSILGSERKVIEVSTDANTGLNGIYVVYDASGCTFEYVASSGGQLNASRYSNLGAAYSEEVRDAVIDGSTLSFPLTADDYGYIIQDGDRSYYYWVVNYANHYLRLDGVNVSEEQDCDYNRLLISGDASAINYYTINGQSRVLSREIYVDYMTEVFDASLPGYRLEDVRKTYESFGNQLSVTPPAYCSTFFTVNGDRFLREWNLSLEVETNVVAPMAVECNTEAEQQERDSDEASNQIKGDGSGLGGSAPAEISFTAFCTEGVLHYEWQMSRDPNFDNPDYRFYQKDLDYTFMEEGNFYLRFIGSNADGTCETYGDTYTVSIGASELLCPNAFSPNDDGVNDIWKVSYRSIVDFNCEIFNRNGQKIYGFSDPEGGWDGTWNGKKVKPGVYFYVIVATGADGKKYKKSGDINIINSVKFDNTTYE